MALLGGRAIMNESTKLAAATIPDGARAVTVFVEGPTMPVADTGADAHGSTGVHPDPDPEVGKAATVAEQVLGLDGVTSADDVTGPYDVIVCAEADTMDELGRMVVSNVQMVDGLTRTLTCPIVQL